MRVATPQNSQSSNLCRAVGNDGTSLLEGGDLVLGTALAAGDDGTGVTHPPAWGSSAAGNEGNNGLGLGAGSVVFQEVLGGCRREA